MLLVSQIPNMKTNCSTKCYVITAQQMHMFVITKIGSKFLGIPDPRKRERELPRRPVLHAQIPRFQNSLRYAVFSVLYSGYCRYKIGC